MMILSPTRKSIALLLDPDKEPAAGYKQVIRDAAELNIDFILTGGSLTFNHIAPLIDNIKEWCHIPVILFPGNLTQITGNADYVLLLSMISGRNPELLIGNHVIAAPFLKNIRHKVIPTGYMLIGSESPTSVHYMSQTNPIPASKSDIAVATAIAGELLGMKQIYLEAGSGASSPVPAELIEAVRSNINIPIIVGGGIKTSELVAKAYRAGANMVVTGNAVEEDISLLREAVEIRNNFNKHLDQSLIASPE